MTSTETPQTPSLPPLEPGWLGPFSRGWSPLRWAGRLSPCLPLGGCASLNTRNPMLTDADSSTTLLDEHKKRRQGIRDMTTTCVTGFICKCHGHAMKFSAPDSSTTDCVHPAHRLYSTPVKWEPERIGMRLNNCLPAHDPGVSGSACSQNKVVMATATNQGVLPHPQQWLFTSGGSMYE